MSSSPGIVDSPTIRKDDTSEEGPSLMEQDPSVAIHMEKAFRSHFLFSKIEDLGPVLKAMRPFLFYPGDVIIGQVRIMS